MVTTAILVYYIFNKIILRMFSVYLIAISEIIQKITPGEKI